MITIYNKKKGFYKVFKTIPDWEKFTKNNGIKFSYCRKWFEKVEKAKGNKFITVLEVM